MAFLFKEEINKSPKIDNKTIPKPTKIFLKLKEFEKFKVNKINQNMPKINADSLFQAGAARVLTEKNLNSKKFLHAVMSLVHNQKELDKMSRSSLKLGHPNATKKIVDHIIKAIG